MSDLLPYHEARLASALECNADLNRQFFAKSLELDRLKANLSKDGLDLMDRVLGLEAKLDAAKLVIRELIVSISDVEREADEMKERACAAAMEIINS